MLSVIVSQTSEPAFQAKDDNTYKDFQWFVPLNYTIMHNFVLIWDLNE